MVLVLILGKSSARRHLETITPYKLTSTGEKLRSTDNSKSMYLLTAELAKSKPPVFQDPPGDVKKMSKVWDAHYEGNLVQSRGINEANKIKTLLVNVHGGETKLNQFQTSEMTKSTIIQFVKNPNYDFDAGEEAEGNFLESTGLGTPPLPPLKKLQIEFTKEAVYRMSHREVRLGGWGSEGPKGPTLGRHASACATILRLRALLYLRASH